MSERVKIEVDRAHYDALVDAAVQASAELEAEVQEDPEASLLRKAWKGLDRAIAKPDAQAALVRLVAGDKQ